jgi:hypothetical protein
MIHDEGDNLVNEQLNLALVLAAGAAAVFRPNRMTVPVSERALYDAYEALKNLLRARYPTVDLDILDISPNSEQRRNVLEEQLRQSGAVTYEDVQAQAATLMSEIFAHAPEAAQAIGLKVQ